MILSTLFLQAVTASPILNAVIWIVVMGLIFYLLWWALDKIALGQPFDKVLRVILVVAVVVVLINFLLGILGSPF